MFGGLFPQPFWMQLVHHPVVNAPATRYQQLTALKDLEEVAAQQTEIIQHIHQTYCTEKNNAKN